MSGDGRRLVNVMREMSKQPENELVDIVTGTVTSVSPLKIKINKIELTETFLILSPFCKERVVSGASLSITGHTHDISGTTGANKSAITDPKHTHTLSSGTAQTAATGITLSDHDHTFSDESTNNHSTIGDILLWRGLQIGDNVLMLKCGRGQTYYVLQRREGATP